MTGGLCILLAAGLSALPAQDFTLSWTHSVEKTEWREAWRVTSQGLVATEARVKGSGAGMDPPEGSILKDGWWVWTPKLPPLPELVLAASGATGAGWTLCAAGQCRELGAQAGEAIHIRPCAAQ